MGARGAALLTPPECAAWLARLGSTEPRANWRASLFLTCGPLVWQRGPCGQASKVCTKLSLRSNWRASLLLPRGCLAWRRAPWPNLEGAYAALVEVIARRAVVQANASVGTAYWRTGLLGGREESSPAFVSGFRKK